MKENIIQNERKCNGCTKCCEGWLPNKIYGYDMYPGKNCHFMKEEGCSIYNKRPESCQTFECEWLQNLSVPEWLYPKTSGIILTRRKKDNISYLQAKEAGKKLSVEALNWLVLQNLHKGLNICYQINEGWNYIGSQEFIDLFNKENQV